MTKEYKIQPRSGSQYPPRMYVIGDSDTVTMKLWDASKKEWYVYGHMTIDEARDSWDSHMKLGWTRVDEDDKNDRKT